MNKFRKLILGVLISALILAGYFALKNPVDIYMAINSVLNLQPSGDTLKQSNQPAIIPNSTRKSNQTAYQLYDQLKHKYALKPDNRFIQAAVEIKSLLSSQQAVSAELEFHDGVWHVYLDQEKIGEIPEIPSFEQGLDFVSLYTDRLLNQYPMEFSRVSINKADTNLAGSDGFYPQELTQNLINLDRQWQGGERSEQVLQAVLQNLVRMIFGSIDELRFNDVLASRTIAVLVLSKKLFNTDQNKLESQLAYKFGYRSHAEFISRKLPENDTWKLFIQKDIEGLKKQLLAVNGVPEARFYLLKRYCQVNVNHAFY